MEELFPDRTWKSIVMRAHRLGIKMQHESRWAGMSLSGTMISHLPETERAYLAGIIDGEGCLRFSKFSNKGHPCFHVSVEIANTSKLLLAWLDERMPGAAYHTPRKHKNPKWRDCYAWKVAGNRKALILLRELLPYLVIKKQQAELLLKGYIHLSLEDRIKLMDELSRLKRDN